MSATNITAASRCVVDLSSVCHDRTSDRAGKGSHVMALFARCLPGCQPPLHVRVCGGTEVAGFLHKLFGLSSWYLADGDSNPTHRLS